MTRLEAIAAIWKAYDEIQRETMSREDWDMNAAERHDALETLGITDTEMAMAAIMAKAAAVNDMIAELLRVQDAEWFGITDTEMAMAAIMAKA